MYVTTNDGEQHQIIIFRQPEPELFPNSKKYKEAIQVELFLLDAGNLIIYFDAELTIIPHVYYLSKVVDEGKEFKKMILNFINEGNITLPNFVTLVVTRFCEINNAHVLMSKSITEPYKNRKFIFAGKKEPM